MLQSIHDRLKGPISSIIIVLISLTFIFWGMSYYFYSNKQKNNVIKVNSSIITQEEFNAYIRLAQYTSGALFEHVKDKEKLKSLLLEQFITEKILMQAAQKEGFYISDMQVAQFILSFFESQGVFHKKQFYSFLRNLGYTEEAFSQQIRSILLLDQLKSVFYPTQFVLPQEIQLFNTLIQQKRDIQYVVISKNAFSSLAISSDLINDYYQKHLSLFHVPEQIQLSYILLSRDALTKNIFIQPQEVQQYLKEHVRLQVLSEKKIRKILLQQKLDSLYANLIEKLTDLTYENPQSLIPAAKALNVPIQNTAFFSKEDRDLPPYISSDVLAAVFQPEVLIQRNNSNLIELDEGHAIVVRVNHYKPAIVQPLTQVQDHIKKQLQDLSQKQQALNVAQNLTNNINQNEKLDSQYLSFVKSLKWILKSDVKREDKSFPLAFIQTIFHTPLNKAAFVQMPNGDYAILKVLKVYYPEKSVVSDDLIQNLSQQYGDWEYFLYQNSLLKKAKIEV